MNGNVINKASVMSTILFNLMLQRTCVSQKEKRKGRGTLRNTEVLPSKICYLAINYQASFSFSQKIAHPVPEGILRIHFWYSFQNNTKINRNRQENKNLPPEVLIAIFTSVAADEKKDGHCTPLQDWFQTYQPHHKTVLSVSRFQI